MSAIHYLHSMCIVHRDMKHENVLFVGDGAELKIADFGFSKIINFEGEMMKTVCGTDTYMAPEIVANPDLVPCYTKACDVWSCGVILFGMLSGSHPFDQDLPLPSLLRCIADGRYGFRSPRWAFVSEEARALVRGMMTVDPAARPAADACLRHPWLRAGPCRPLPEAGTPLAETPHRDVLGCADAAACISSPAPEVVWQSCADACPPGRLSDADSLLRRGAASPLPRAA
mmetsp:Transcript_30016/g.79145  ORF Transcript_30016/g.79145 Transcript_30016/m.79145 type:complete len:229 (-) Transcript_30016:1200-1886(-)